MSPWLIGTLIFLAIVTVISIARNVSPRFRQWFRLDIKREDKDESKEKKRSFGIDIGILIGVIKFLWNGRTAPNGSWEKIGWNIFLIAAIAIGLWIIVCFIDKRINGSQPEYSKAIDAAPGEKVG